MLCLEGEPRNPFRCPAENHYDKVKESPPILSLVSFEGNLVVGSWKLAGRKAAPLTPPLSIPLLFCFAGTFPQSWRSGFGQALPDERRAPEGLGLERMRGVS